MNPFVRYGLLTFGIVFIILGVIGLFLPVLQGVIFLAIGLYILSLVSKRLKRSIDRHLSRFPRAQRIFERYSHKIDRILGQKKGVSGSENDQKRGEGGPEA